MGLDWGVSLFGMLRITQSPKTIGQILDGTSCIDPNWYNLGYMGMWLNGLRLRRCIGGNCNSESSCHRILLHRPRMKNVSGTGECRE